MAVESSCFNNVAVKSPNERKSSFSFVMGNSIKMKKYWNPKLVPIEGGDDVKPLMAFMNWATHDATMIITKGSE